MENWKMITPKRGMEVKDIDINPTHPGIYLESDIKHFGISFSDLQKTLNITTGEIQSVLSGKSDITLDLSHKLSSLFGTSPSYWYNLQQDYNEKL